MTRPGMHDDVPPNAFAHPIRVEPAWVDLQGVVANHEIVRIFVETAARHSESLGWDLEAYRRLGAWWVVRCHEVDYVQPAALGDDLVCRTWPSAMRRTSAQRRHVLVRPADEAVIARGINTWALIDMPPRRPRRIPRELAETFDPAKWGARPDA